MGRHRKKRSSMKIILAGAVAGVIIGAGTFTALAVPFSPAGTSPAETSPVFTRLPVRIPPPSLPVTRTASYTVRSGDTLWGIARSHCGTGADAPALQKDNHLGGILHIGKVITLAC